MQILLIATHFFTFMWKPLYPHKYAKSQHCRIKIDRSLSHFCTTSFSSGNLFDWITFVANETKLGKKQQNGLQRTTRPPELELNIWTLQNPELKDNFWKCVCVVSFLTSYRFSLGRWQLWIPPSPYLSHPNFLPPYRWHNRDWAQPSICPTLPFPFPHQTMPQECNFDKLKRKWVWGVLTKKSSTNIIYIFKRKKSSGTVAVKFLQAVFSPLQKTESSQSLVSSNGAAYN